MITATLNNLWFSIRDTGRKVATFLLDQCTVTDIVIIGVVLWIL